MDKSPEVEERLMHLWNWKGSRAVLPAIFHIITPKSQLMDQPGPLAIPKGSISWYICHQSAEVF